MAQPPTLLPADGLQNKEAAAMWNPVILHMLMSVCSADPAVGCIQTVINGFVSQRASEATAVNPITEMLRSVKPYDVPVAVTVTCVGIETQEA